MLHELRVENLLLMQRAELRLAPGLNMLTGETGAGKTLLAHALDLLLGGKARRDIVRPGAAEAYVEGVFALPPALADSERLPADAEEIVLARRVWPDGRTRAYVCGRAATQADLQELGSQLLSFYGQHEHRKLMLSTAQLELLDAYIGSGQQALREQLRGAHERVRELEGRAVELRELAGARDRELDLLTFELDEIEAAAPTEAEQADLSAERDRLRHQEVLVHAATVAADSLTPEAGVGATELLAEATGRLENVMAVDPRLTTLAQRLEVLRYESEDITGELRGYLAELDGGEDGAGRLEEVEERLALLARLERKHGGTIADVLAHAERCRARREELQNADSALEAVEAELAQARSERDALAGRLSKARRSKAPKLAAAVRERLAELAMADARFEIELSPRPDGCGPARRRRHRDADRRQRRGTARTAARGRLRRRALAGDAGAAQRGPRDVRRPPGRRRRPGRNGLDARLRRDRRRYRRAHRAGGGRAPAGPVRGAPDPLHHPSAPGGGAGRPAFHDRQGRLGDAGDHHGERAGRRRGRLRAGSDARRRIRGSGRQRARPRTFACRMSRLCSL